MGEALVPASCLLELDVSGFRIEGTAGTEGPSVLTVVDFVKSVGRD